MKIGIFGGNGFVGSAVARKAVARGWKVVSFSRSGKAFQTPAGHTPAWAEEVSAPGSFPSPAILRLRQRRTQVEWRKASAFDPTTYEAELPSCDALVSTLGILFEADYKSQGQARPLAVLKAIAESATGSRGNPLAKQTDRSYERINRDSGESLVISGPSKPLLIADESALAHSALSLYHAFHQSRAAASAEPSPFVFISAEDIFRPFVPQRYISTKRAAEAAIWQRAQAEKADRPVRPILMRPSAFFAIQLAIRHSSGLTL